MNLMGIDVGTTGCKTAVFSLKGKILASAYREYDIQFSQPGWAQLDSASVWNDVKDTIKEVTSAIPDVQIGALSVSSLGESVVPVTADRKILGPSLLNFDARGEEFLAGLAEELSDQYLYAINGNPLGNLYTLTKLKWICKYQPELYAKAYKFLFWGDFISFMLGADPKVDYSLANRTLLFDINKGDWSDELLRIAGLDRSKLPETVPSGKKIGVVSDQIARELGLPDGVQIISGAHDQCANAVGCGVIDPGSAVYGMGTYHCITPVFSTPPDPNLMLERGLNTEHHAVPDRFACFIYNQGGSLVKWYRDTFAAEEYHRAIKEGHSIYPKLLEELPEKPSRILVLPHFSNTGTPDFITDSSGVMVGLRLETQRGEILKGIIEGIAFYLKEVVDSLPATGIKTENYRVVGGGSKSDVWIQTCADIFGQPFLRPVITEAGALGAAIIAGVGSGIFADYTEGVDAMIRIERTFEPNLNQHKLYQTRYDYYKRMWPLMSDYLRSLSKETTNLA
jgi:xylulokinase